MNDLLYKYMPKDIGEFSIHKQEFFFRINGIKYDISDKVPQEVWDIGKEFSPRNPIDHWKIRIELKKIFMKYFRENIDPNIQEEDVEI